MIYWWQHLSWSRAAAVMCLPVIAVSAYYWIKEGMRRRRAETLRRLNSPFFRCVYDRHYRAGK